MTGSTAISAIWPRCGPIEVLTHAIGAAPRQRRPEVTAHVFSEDALAGLIAAGIDSIEHGTGLTDDTIELMVKDHGTALVPTLINIENFPGASPMRRKGIRRTHGT